MALGRTSSIFKGKRAIRAATERAPLPFSGVVQSTLLTLGSYWGWSRIRLCLIFTSDKCGALVCLFHSWWSRFNKSKQIRPKATLFLLVPPQWDRPHYCQPIFQFQTPVRGTCILNTCILYPLEEKSKAFIWRLIPTLINCVWNNLKVT